MDKGLLPVSRVKLLATILIPCFTLSRLFLRSRRGRRHALSPLKPLQDFPFR